MTDLRNLVRDGRLSNIQPDKDPKLIAMATVCALAAAAPVAPSEVLNGGIWPALLILILRWRKADLVDGLAVALAAWATTAAIDVWAVPSAQLGVSNYWTVCLIFVAVRCTIASRGEFALVGGSYLAGCVYAAVDIIQQSRTFQSGADTSDVRLGLEGVNPNYTAYALATGVFVAAGMLACGGLTKKTRILLLATLPVLASGTAGTGTRGAQGAIVVAGGYLLLAKFAPRSAHLVAFVGGPTLLLLIPIGVYGDTRLLWLQDYFGRASSNLSGRLYLWPLARQLWEQHLWTGIGPNMFPMSNPFNIGAHSLVLTVGAELGLIGLALYAAAFGMALARSAKTSATARQMAGLLIVTSLPLWLSGTWEASPAAWLVVAVWSRFPLPHKPRPSSENAVDIERPNAL